MSIKPQKYVRKPIIAEAIQVTEENFYEVAHWCNGEPITANFPYEFTEKHIHVRVHSPKSERQKRAHVGDWVLYSSNGYKIYEDRAFQRSFDLEPSEELKQAWDKFRSEFHEAGQKAMAELSRAIENDVVDGTTRSKKKHFRSRKP